MRIPDKQTFLRLQAEGRTGNFFSSWNTVAEAERECSTGGVYIRGPYAQWAHMVPWCPIDELERTANDIHRRSGGDRPTFVEVLPFGTPRSINAELAQSTDYWWLTWGDSNTLSLRQDIAENGTLAVGLAAETVLREKVPPQDRDMLNEILEDFPGATIEFSVFGRTAGVQGRNTIVWEVRHY